MNLAAAEMFGLDRETTVGHELAELMIPPDLRDRHREALKRFRRTGRGRVLGRRLELTGMRADGVEFPVELTIARVALPDPEEVMFTGTIRDITMRRRAEELEAKLFESERAAREHVERAHDRSAFLADASVILGGSLDHRRTLAKIARLIVPRLADWCSVDLSEPDGTIQSVAVAHADPEKVELTREYRRRFPPEISAEGGVARRDRVRRAGHLPGHAGAARRTDAKPSGGPWSRARAAIRDGGSAQGAGEALGSITFASADSGRTFGEAVLELAQELARRAALALDNARLYEERSHIARTLQRSLLPRRLPEIPGIEVAAFYQAAGVSQTEVGGDFYDVIEAADEAWGVIVGDVCGKASRRGARRDGATHLRVSVHHEPRPRGPQPDDAPRRRRTVLHGRARAAGADLRRRSPHGRLRRPSAATGGSARRGRRHRRRAGLAPRRLPGRLDPRHRRRAATR
jgi:PAS domain S-box-containing protein